MSVFYSIGSSLMHFFGFGIAVPKILETTVSPELIELESRMQSATEQNVVESHKVNIAALNTMTNSDNVRIAIRGLLNNLESSGEAGHETPS